LELVNLDDQVRAAMRKELEIDSEGGTLYLSNRLSSIGRERYPALLDDAFQRGTPATLAQALAAPGVLKTTEHRNRNGRTIEAKVPVTAPVTLAEGEFNRFYLRGLCQVAVDAGINQIEVYRARESAMPRPESEEMIGRRLDAAELLQDLRTKPGVDTALGLPPGPNSGLSGRLSR
jgi:hypothetical protein